VLEFNVLIASQPNQPPSLRLNVKLRQHLEEALSYLSTMYEICVFTAGEQDYADTILNFIDERREIIKHRLYRQHCVRPEVGVYVKDLDIIADRDMKNMMLVDNSIISFAF
jgi:CTD small phosphatase-like protein 2